MAMSCGQVGRLSVASAGGHATEAERLELEAHFATCARCTAEHAIVLGATRVLRSAEPGALSSAARERVRRAALAKRAHAPVTARRFGWPLAGGAVLAMAAAVAIWIGVRKPAELSVVGGDVTVAAAPAASAQAADGAARAVQAVIVRSGRGGEVKLADASTALAPATEIVWRHERRVVELREGSLTVDVAHRPGQHFEVHTPRFVVEVVGTRFSVDLAGVRTERGTVRVLSPDRKLIGTLEGGHSWTLPTPHAETPPATPAGGARAARRADAARQSQSPSQAQSPVGRRLGDPSRSRAARARARQRRRGAPHRRSRCSGWAATSPPRRARSTRSRT